MPCDSCGLQLLLRNPAILNSCTWELYMSTLYNYTLLTFVD